MQTLGDTERMEGVSFSVRKDAEYGYLVCTAESMLAFMDALYYENKLVASLPGREQASL